MSDSVKNGRQALIGKLVGGGYQFLTDTGKQNQIVAKAGTLKDDAKTLYMMVKDYMSGEYTAIPKTSIAIAAGALLYFVSPDLIPGPFDDMLVISTAVAVLGEDLKDYKLWKKNNIKPTKLVLELEDGSKVELPAEKIPLHISERVKEIAGEASEDERIAEGYSE